VAANHTVVSGYPVTLMAEVNKEKKCNETHKEDSKIAATTRQKTSSNLWY